MGQLAVGAAGAAVGSIWGNPFMGFSVGMTIGGILFPERQSIAPANTNVQGSSYGTSIPIVFGDYRVGGSLIWANPLREIAGSSSGGGSGGLAPSSGAQYQLDAAFLICEGPVSLMQVWADSDLIIDYTRSPVYYAPFVASSMFAFHPGSANSTDTGMGIDSTMYATLGTNTPSYTNRATFVVHNFPWSRYGHTPNFTFHVQQAASPTLSSVLTSLFARVNVVFPDCDFSAVSGITVDGFLVPGRGDLASIVKPLQDAYHFDLVEVDGVIKASLRSASATFTIDPKWMGVNTDGEAPTYPVEIRRLSPVDLPRSLDVAYASAARDYQSATQTVRRFITTSQNSDSVSFPLVLSDNSARDIGESLIYERWLNRQTYKLTYTPDYLSIAPGDSGTITVNGQTKTVRILNQTMGMLGHLESMAVDHDPSIYTQILPGSGFSGGSIIPGSGTLNGLAADVNAPFDRYVLNSGYEHGLIAGALGRPGTAWRGGAIGLQPGNVLYSDFNERVTQSMQFPSSSTFGQAAAALPNASPFLIDTTSTLTVVMVAGSPSSCSDDDFLRGATNIALVGSEYIQFRHVTQVSTGVYQLSHLMRGKRGTEAAIAGHGSSEMVVFVDTNCHYWYTSPSYSANPTTVGLVGWENSTDPSNNILIPNVPNVTNNIRPYAPTNIAASRDGSGNITLTWSRRSRITGSNPWTVGFDTYDSSRAIYEVYWVDVMSGSTVLRSYQVICQSKGVVYLTSPSLLISAADQTAMSGGLMNPIAVNVYQANYFLPTSNGRGYAGYASL